MGVYKEPFTRYKTDEELDPNDITFTLRITPKDMAWFKPAKKFIQQPKNSTAIKQLARIGATNVLLDEKIRGIFDTISNNFRRNDRMGITERDFKINKKQTKITQNDIQK